jgi:hypothetical protein
VTHLPIWAWIIIALVLVVAASGIYWWRLRVRREAATQEVAKARKLMADARSGNAEALQLVYGVASGSGDYELRLLLDQLGFTKEVNLLWQQKEENDKFKKLQPKIAQWIAELEQLVNTGDARHLERVLELEIQIYDEFYYKSDNLRMRLLEGQVYSYAGAVDRISALRQQQFDAAVAQFEHPVSLPPAEMEALRQLILQLIKTSRHDRPYVTLRLPPNWNQLIAQNFICPALAYFDGDQATLEPQEQRVLVGLALQMVEHGNVGPTSALVLKLATAYLGTYEHLSALFPGAFERLQRAAFSASPLTGTAYAALPAGLLPDQ